MFGKHFKNISDFKQTDEGLWLLQMPYLKPYQDFYFFWGNNIPAEWVGPREQRLYKLKWCRTLNGKHLAKQTLTREAQVKCLKFIPIYFLVGMLTFCCWAVTIHYVFIRKHTTGMYMSL